MVNVKLLLGRPLKYCMTMLSIWCLSSMPVMAKEDISIAVLEIPYLVSQEKDKRGIYNDFLDSLEGVTTVYSPPARSKMLFRRGSVNCIFPAGLTAYHVPFEIIQSQPVRTIKAYLYTNEQYNSVKVKKGDNIAIRRGFTFGGFRVRNPANYIDLDSDQSTLKFLQRNRVSGVIAYHPDIVLAAKESGIAMPFYQKEQPIYKAKDAILCRADVKTRKFLKATEERVQTFRQSQNITD